jgi:DNA replication and repair protein RecF
MTIKGWRNYTGEKVEFLPGINLFIGKNGQGKTNLLEAVYFLTSGHSPRSGRTEDLINWQENYFFIAGRVRRGQRVTLVEMGAARDGRRVYKVDGTPIQRLSDIGDYVNSIFFLPEDLFLVKGGPALRRRFLDMEIGQIDSSYRLLVREYKKFLRERNALLKSKVQDKILMNVLTEKLAELSGPISQKRQDYLQKLSVLARLKHRKLSFNSEELSLKYKASVEPGLPCAGVMELFKKAEGLEHRYKATLVGPHRDDFIFIVNGSDLRAFGSQGQQRTAVLSVKLAEIELFKGETGEYPLLLLDDVFSELDGERKAMLLQDLSGKVQTFISSVESPPGPGIKTFWIESGKIRERE